MSASNTPLLRELVESALQDLEDPGRPVSSILPRVIRIAGLLGDHENRIRFTLETIDFEDLRTFRSVLNQFSPDLGLDDASRLKEEVGDDYFNGRRAVFSSMGQSQRSSLVRSIAAIEQMDREYRREIASSRQTMGSFEWIYYNESDRDIHRRSVTTLENALRDHQAILDRVRAKVHEFLVRVEVRIASMDAENRSIGDGEATTMPDQDSSRAPDPRRVFVVYGQDEQARTAVFDLLRAVDLVPLDWGQVVRLTGQGAPYIGEILDVGMREAQAIVVLFTGDEVAQLRKDLVPEGKRARRFEPQPRPNVILEAGMAIAKYPNRTIIVQIGTVREISDLSGRHVIRLDGSQTKRKDLLIRLQTAGCSVDLSGDDWMKMKV